MALGLALAIAAIASSVASGAATYVGQQKADDKTKKAQRFERRKAELENAKNARRAIAQRRIQQADILASNEATGTRSNSAVSGAVGSLTTQTAANTGFANTGLAGSIGVNSSLRAANRQTAIFGNIAQGFDVASQAFTLGALGNFNKPKPLGGPPPTINPTVTILNK